MGDLGAIGTLGLARDEYVQSLIQSGNGVQLRRLVPGTMPPLFLGTGRDDADGNPAPPSLKLRGLTEWVILWPLKAGVNTFAIDCKYGPDDGAGARPQVILRADDTLGIHADLVVTLGAGADAWQTSPTISVTPRAAGVARISLVTRNTRPDGVLIPVYANFDKIAVG